MQKDNLRSLAITTSLGEWRQHHCRCRSFDSGTGIGSIRVWQVELESIRCRDDHAEVRNQPHQWRHQDSGSGVADAAGHRRSVAGMLAGDGRLWFGNLTA